jgi:hypothetical protein
MHSVDTIRALFLYFCDLFLWQQIEGGRASVASLPTFFTTEEVQETGPSWRRVPLTGSNTDSLRSLPLSVDSARKAATMH